jgi:fatty-acyl-CoA synthase
VSRPATIPEALFATAERGAGEYVFHLEEGPVSLSCGELAERALRGARRLIALGVEPGDAVGVLGPNRPEWVVGAFAAWIAGAVLVPVQIPLRISDPDAFRERLRSLVEAGGCRRVLADPRLAALLPAGVALAWEEAGEKSAALPSMPEAGAPAVIQFTSGSTAAPKGALLAHSAVMAQMEIFRTVVRYPDGTPRRMLSWTPFFHDLGLVANLVHPSHAGATIHHLPTERFAADPAEWLRLVEASGAALTVGPSSAFGSALRAARRRGERIDLSSLDAAYFAAEGVDPEIARRMVETAEDFGLRPTALGSTYGLAEAVMAVTHSPIGTGLRIDRISLEELGSSGLAVPAGDGPVRLVVSCGEPQMDLRIAAAGGLLPERHMGEIQVRGRSTMSGYVGADAPDPFVDGWLRTGDLGYLADGELYVTGRAKDVMIAMGHNYYPEDFEWAAARVDAVRPGRCVAFSLPGAEQVVVLVEASGNGGAEGLEREVDRAVKKAVGVAPSEVVVLPRGTIEKTTSGKLRRAAMRDAYLSGALEVGGQ